MLKTLKTWLALAASLLLINGWVFAADAPYYDETYRPQYHFSSEANWINDPNGMLYYAGEYHLFYQYHPYSEVWGPMHWGHAVSTDMVHWQHLPIALTPDADGAIFSGSAVVDWNNTAGFGVEAMVAIYTANGANQKQSIAYSIDKGRTWTKYTGNPVIPNPGLVDFRDPKVFWHAATSRWVMVLAAGDRAKIYTSPNLKTWAWRSDFGVGQGSHGGVWECPDLFPLPVDGNTGNVKWVMTVNNGGAPAGGTGWQYFVGSFDGTTFTNSNPAATVLWGDFGSDNYAGVTFGDIPAVNGRRIMIPWASNWNYAEATPTSVWRSHMGLPKQLELKTLLPEGIRLVQSPVVELNSLRKTASNWGAMTVNPGTNILAALSGDAYEIDADFQVSTSSASEFGFKVRKGGSQFTTVGYNKLTSKLFIDRANSGASSFNASFPAFHSVSLAPDASGRIKIHLYVDRDSVEVFGNDGKVLLSDLIFPERGSLGMEMYATGGSANVNAVGYYPLQKAWGGSQAFTNLTGWRTVAGRWADTIQGKQGRMAGDGFLMSSNTSSDFTYEADLKVLNAGAAALVFRADANAGKGYVANIATDGLKLFKFNGNGTATVLAQTPTTLALNTSYHLKVVTLGSNIQVYLGSTLVFNINDTSYASGYFGLNIWNGTSAFQNVRATNVNTPPLAQTLKYDFESGNLNGWTVQSGTAFTNADVVSNLTWWGGNFNPQGNFHYWGFKNGGDARVGSMKTANFVLGGNGNVNFLVSGGNNTVGLYVALVRASDNAILFKATGNNSETYVRTNWDASAYVGTNCYIQVVDSATGNWGHINVDDINIAVQSTTGLVTNLAGLAPVSGSWSTSPGGLTGSSTGDGFDLSTTVGSNVNYAADITVNTGGSGALVFRSNNTGSNAYVANVDVTNQFVKLFKFVNGSATILATYSTALVGNQTYNLRVLANGTSLQVFLNGASVISATDASFGSGQLGVNVWNGSSTFQNVNLLP